jgi:hypothetical protein
MVNTCCVVDEFCTSPANLDPPTPARGICFSCGLNVCSKCSSKRKYYDFGVVRLCNNCQIDYDGNDRIVYRRIMKMAGYR